MSKTPAQQRSDGGGQSAKRRQQGRPRVKKSQAEDAEVKRLEVALQQSTPQALLAAKDFTELPLSQATIQGLDKHGFKTMTAVQRAALPHVLAGRDLLGAAKTGSGKTLCFLIPVMERLFRSRWTRFDGLGALVLTPTRELALQIFQELRKVGTAHDLSAGLLIGGKAVKEEAATINRMNILVATPGRLLQHMDETPGFDASPLQMLVLDEADRILDMGFAETLDAILQNLPRQRQTLLFSATQTKSVKDLARLSLSDPEYVSVHAESDSATPLKLQQAVAVVDAQSKMDTLWSFIKSHLTAKTIVFLSTCKQVRFFHEALKKLRPGVPLRALHGGMKQMKRMAVFQDFCEAEHMVLFATDVAGRGLDFPSVDWVLQVDCPEDTAAYIHRVGRTARYLASGRALLLLTPSEAPGMLAALEAAKIPVKTIRVNPAAQQSIGPALAALLSKNVELKEFAQRALVAYVRSLVLAPSKEVFAGVGALPLEELAVSWGLLAAPRMRFLKKVGKKQQTVLELGGGTGTLDLQDPDDPVSDEDAAAADQAPRTTPATASSKQRSSQHQGEAAVAVTGGAGENGAGAAAQGHGVEGRKQRTQKGEAAQEGGQAAQAGSRSAGASRSSREAGRAAALSAGAADDGGDDDFLVVKRQDVFAEGGDLQAASAMDADDAGAGGGPKKKKKLKIKVGRSTGQRVVFDEAGTALAPLAALALEGLGQAAASGGAEDPDAGAYVVRDMPADRFQAAAEGMRRRDATDKAQLRESRKAAKLEQKEKRRAQAALEAGLGGGVQLRQPGTVADDDGDDGGDQQEDGMGSGSDDEDDDAGLQGPGGRASPSEEDEEEDMRPQRGASASAQARKGPGKRASGGAEEQAAAAKLSKRARHKGVEALSLAEQEQLALRLLGVS